MKKTFMTMACVMICTLLSAMHSHADYKHETAARMRARLSTVRTPRDSIRILYDVLDLLPRKEQPPVGLAIDSIASRIGDNAVRLDVARLMTACYDDDRNLARIEDKVASIPASQEQKETQLFLKMKRICLRTKHMSEEERQADIIHILSETEDNKAKTPSRQLLDLFTLVEHLRNVGTGDMLKEYLDRLSAMAASTHFRLYAISNLIQSEAANIYTDAGDTERAVAADRKLLQIIGGLEKKYADMGRKYRNYDVSRYVSYRRMLRNHTALQSGEIEKIHAEVMKLAASNPEVNDDISKQPRYRAYHAMATGDYNTAIPLLKQILDQDNRPALRKQLLEFLIKASENVGDNDTKIEALTQYAAILEDFNRLKADQRYRELQIKYDIQDLRSRNAQLELQSRNDEVLSSKRIMTLVVIAFILIFGILVVSLYHWGRFKKNASIVGDVVDNIHEERESLTDSLFDCEYKNADPMVIEERKARNSWNRRLRAKGARWDNISLYLTRSIVNDLLYIACTGHNVMRKHIQETTADTVLRHAEATARHSDDGKERIIVNYPEQDIHLTTDVKCLTMLMDNIFDISFDYSPTRTVEISCRSVDQYIDFIITTVGARPANIDDPQLFDDFSTAKKLLRMQNSGMFICRMISMLLQCRFIPDISYTEGCRYTFRMPVKLNTGVR